MKISEKWLEGARPKTLPAAIAPVLLGTAIAISINQFAFIPAILCLLIALSLQVACNLSNDYSDGIKGTDDNRVGPKRLVASNLASPSEVLKMALLSYFSAGIFGILLVLYTQKWWLIIVGILALLASWYYTGGQNPYGYKGYGELSVFIFFGLVATIGTVYVQTNTVPVITFFVAIAIGLLSTAMLLVNNIRDIDTDLKAGKHTLATKLGVNKSKALYALFIVLPLIIAIPMFVYAKLSILATISVIWILKALKLTLQSDKPKDLILALKTTGQLEIIYALSLSIGIALRPFTG